MITVTKRDKSDSPVAMVNPSKPIHNSVLKKKRASVRESSTMILSYNREREKTDTSKCRGSVSLFTLESYSLRLC